MTVEDIRKNERVLISAKLKPVQGTRFQATGFPEVGPALYQATDGRNMLLLESNQSMANRMEAVCWDEAAARPVSCLQGLPYVAVMRDGKMLTNSLLEAHRVNSPYIMESKDKAFSTLMKTEIGLGDEEARVDIRRFARFLFKYDPNSLIHGVFIAKEDIAGGRMRLPRALSGFIEASDVSIATSGGVKRDDVNPRGDTKKGFGHVPFVREEFTGNATAYFNLDMALIRGYGLGTDAEELLATLALYKVSRFLRDGLKLRTACDLECSGPAVMDKPAGKALPSVGELEAAMQRCIERCRDMFCEPVPYQVIYEKP
jgi:CRISPR-associated protein Csb1